MSLFFPLSLCLASALHTAVNSSERVKWRRGAVAEVGSELSKTEESREGCEKRKREDSSVRKGWRGDEEEMKQEEEKLLRALTILFFVIFSLYFCAVLTNPYSSHTSQKYITPLLPLSI